MKLKSTEETRLNSPSCLPYFAGQKVHDAFQLKRGPYTDLPAAKISEMMHPSSLDVNSLASDHVITFFILISAILLINITILYQNAPTQSLLRIVNGILDESIERKRGEIPHVSLFSGTFNKLTAWNLSVYLSSVIDD